MKRTILHFFIISILLLPYYVFGQIKIHKHITQEDGLVSGQVSKMLQDSKGYIWFATYDGVSKWDGKHFENFQTHNGLLSSVVLDIKEGNDGKIYIACYQGGILIYDNGNLDTLNEKNGLLSNSILSILKFPNGDLLFTGTGNKISKYSNGKLSDWSKEVNYPNDVNYTIRDSYFDNDTTLYLATQKGLLIYKNNSFKIVTTKDGLNHNLLFAINGNRNGTVYVGTYKGINKIENGAITKLTDLQPFSNSFVRNIYVTKNGTMYAAMDAGMLKLKNGNIQTFTEDNGLSFNFCHSILEDNNGAIYIGTNGNGVSFYNPNESIINYNKKTGLPSESIWAILKADNGNLYLGSSEGLIIKNKSGTKFLTKKNGLIDNYVRVIKQSRNGKILIGTNSGLSILDKNRITNIPLKNKAGITRVYSIIETDKEDLYVGTQTGIVIIRNGTVVNKKESEELTRTMLKEIGGENILSLSKTKDGAIVFGSMSGAAIYSKGKFTFFTTKNGLVNNSAGVTHVRADGTILIGTLKGINVIKNGEVTDTIDINDGLSNNSIADIAEDDKGRIFVATYKGLNILTNIYDSLNIKQLYKKDGLIGNDFTHEGTYVDREGNIWLGTLFGITKYNPNVDKPISTPPKLYLTGLQLFNKDYPLRSFFKNPKFNYDENFIKFIFIGINLSAPEKIKYKYRLSGIDKNWVETSQNFAPYTNLDNGEYTFEVKARNEWGYWSKPVSASFVISPAWWETWWFYTLVVLAIGSLIAFVSSYKYRHLLAIEKMRSKISADLHDSIGSGLTEISILTELLNAQVPEDKKDFKSGLNNVTTISRSLIESMSDIVWLVNPKKDTLKDLFKRLQMSYQEVLKYTDIDLLVENLDELETIKLPMNFRQHLYLIFKEAINNAIKYSGGDLLNLKIETKGNNLTVFFSDNGKGYDQNKSKMGNGLINMKNRAKQIGGIIEYFSVANKGTTIKFTGKFSKQKI